MLKRVNGGIVLAAVAIILIRLPPLVFVPFFQSLTQTHSLARMISAISLIFFIGSGQSLPFSKANKNQKMGILLLSIFFLTQSLSIVGAVNTTNFFLIYKDLLFAGIFYALGLCIARREKHLALFSYVIMGVASLYVFIQIVTFFFPSLYSILFEKLLYSKYSSFFFYQIERGRFFGDTFDEVAIPFLIFFLAKASSKKRALVLFLIILAISFVTVISQWRTKVLVLATVFLASALFQKKLTLAAGLIGVVFCALVGASFFSDSISGKAFYSRFLFSDVDVQTIQGRFAYWEESIDMGLQNGLTGVGLGNFYDNLSIQSRTASQKSIIDRSIMIDDPHNMLMSIFASSGIVGIISIIVYLTFALITDLKKKSYRGLPFIIASWGLIVFAMLNPFQYASFLYYFWFLRGVADSVN